MITPCPILSGLLPVYLEDFRGLVGLGGGIIMIPLMTLWLKVTQHKAHGTSLVAVVFTGLIGATAYFAYGTGDWKVALLLNFTSSFSFPLFLSG